MRDRPNGELDFDERPDGIHWTPRTARAMADWLGPQIIEIAEQGVAAPSPYIRLAED